MDSMELNLDSVLGGDMSAPVKALLDRGVVILLPHSVHVGEEIDPGRVAPGVVIHPGCRLRGAGTSIGPGSVIGEEAPATLENCQLGHGVALKGGFFSGSVFLDGVNVGSCAHVRPGTIMEEGSSAAHTVGFKQTILFPYVTVGSLVNFCDCLMSGGTGPKDHGEVGSSYIHFNFTPQQDKATASLLGDVPRGVMLDRPPIFLGGQGGLVGPARLEFGSVIAAGVVCRQDILEEGMLFAGHMLGGGRARKFQRAVYSGVGRIVLNNLHYIGNIRALRVWYQVVRQSAMSSDVYREACRLGALSALEAILEERVRRLGEVAVALERLTPEEGFEDEALSWRRAVEVYRRLRESWPGLVAGSRDGWSLSTGAEHREVFLAGWQRVAGEASYPRAVASLDPQTKAAGTAWLRAIVDEVVNLLPREEADPGFGGGA
jgi:UDP-N-acetylglucosamine/UDP-N-acetylgalactosamine diphosphorylase